MNVNDTARVLAKIQAFDRRTIGDSEILVWNEAIGDLELNDCLDAVTAHYRDCTDWLTPAHIRRLAGEADRRRRGRERAAKLATLTSPDGAPLAIEATEQPPARDRSADVAALVQQVAASLPQPDAHARAQTRARAERGRPATEVGKRRRPEDRTKPPKDWPEPADAEIAQMATRYLLDGHDPTDVGDRLGVSRRWCHRTARRYGASPEAAAARAALAASKETTDDPTP